LPDVECAPTQRNIRRRLKRSPKRARQQVKYRLDSATAEQHLRGDHVSKAFASQADPAEKKITFDQLSKNAYAYTAEGDPNTGVISGDADSSANGPQNDNE
jgi:hypothetical protein